MEAGVLDNRRKRFPRIHVAIKVPNNVKKKCLFQTISQSMPHISAQAHFYETSVLEHSSDVRKGWDKVVEDSWGTCPHRKWAQTRRAWLKSWDFRERWALQKQPHRISPVNVFGRKCSPKQQRQDGTSVKFMVVFDAWRISLQPSCPTHCYF